MSWAREAVDWSTHIAKVCKSCHNIVEIVMVTYRNRKDDERQSKGHGWTYMNFRELLWLKQSAMRTNPNCIFSFHKVIEPIACIAWQWLQAPNTSSYILILLCIEYNEYNEYITFLSQTCWLCCICIKALGITSVANTQALQVRAL